MGNRLRVCPSQKPARPGVHHAQRSLMTLLGSHKPRPEAGGWAPELTQCVKMKLYHRVPLTCHHPRFTSRWGPTKHNGKAKASQDIGLPPTHPQEPPCLTLSQTLTKVGLWGSPGPAPHSASSPLTVGTRNTPPPAVCHTVTACHRHCRTPAQSVVHAQSHTQPVTHAHTHSGTVAHTASLT